MEKLILEDPAILAAIFDTYTLVADPRADEEATSAIYDLFEYNDRIMDLMKHIVTYEVERIGKENLFFSFSLCIYFY
jgi:hypothetical protein